MNYLLPILILNLGQNFQEISTPEEGLALAILDAAKYKNCSTFRYVWISDGDDKKWAQVSQTCNIALNRSANIIRPRRLAEGKLVRIDLNLLTTNAEELDNARKTFDKLADPKYYRFDNKLVDVAPYIGATGKRHTQKWIRVPVFDLLYEDPKSGLEGSKLQAITKSLVPIVSYEYFITKALTTLEDGLYYEFIKIKGLNFEQYLKRFGISLKDIDRLNGDYRAGIFRSKVTAKPRIVIVIQGPLGKVTITLDMSDNDDDVSKHPIYNLLGYEKNKKFVAMEVIVVTSNGQLEYTLWDAEGKLQEFVPPDVAHDHHKPAPFTRNLEPGISCIRCHAINKGEDGFKPVVSDVHRMLKGSLDIYDDFGNPKPDLEDSLAELASKFGKESKFQIRLEQARGDYRQVVIDSTDGVFEEDHVTAASSAISNTFQQHLYDPITPQKACRELGYLVEEKDALTTLRLILPELKSTRFFGIPLEDPTLGALKDDINVGRKDFDRAYLDFLRRVKVEKARRSNEKVINPDS